LVPQLNAWKFVKELINLTKKMQSISKYKGNARKGGNGLTMFKDYKHHFWGKQSVELN